MSRRLIFLIASLILLLYLNFSIIMMSLQSSRNVNFFVDFPTTTPSEDMESRCSNPQFRRRPLPVASDPVALVSFPGSGNTWMRHLLEESTGFLTGSVYMDPELYKYFPAENVTDGSVIVVKMHEAERFLRGNYKAAILMIRKPSHAILSEFNRSLKGHLGVVKSSVFASKDIVDWSEYVSNATNVWESTYRVMLSQSKKPVFVVFYERLRKKTSNTLEGVLSFLNHSAPLDTIQCAIVNGIGHFKRETALTINPFTNEMQNRLAIVEETIMRLVGEYMRKHNQMEYFLDTVDISI